MQIEPNLNMSSNLGYTLGVLKGDGSVCKCKRSERRDGYKYIIELQVLDKKFVESFREALCTIGLHPMKIHGYYRAIYKGKIRYEVVASSIRFYNWYSSLTLYDIKKSLLQNKDYVIKFIRGFYESEGSMYVDISSLKSRGKGIRNRKRIIRYVLAIGNMDKELMDLVKELLSYIGFDFYSLVTKHPKGLYYRLRLFKQKEIGRFLQLVKPCIKTRKLGVIINE